MLNVLRRYFLTGLLAVAPLAITVLVVWRLFDFIDAAMRPWAQRVLPWLATFSEFLLTVVALAALVLLITLVGVFTRNLIGIAFFGLVERVMQKIPGVRSLFGVTKQIAEVLLADQRAAFQKVVLIEYPRRGMYSLGFLTSDHPANDLLNVFLPTTPNPTSGYLLVMPREAAAILPLTIEEGVRLIISGGSVINDRQAAALQVSADRLALRPAGAPGPEEAS
ncbi:MAG: DUF502 domain-containing protein [Candidatus Krumholzibacteriia bacterium]